MTSEIRIEYYALFREQRGLSSETRQTSARTVGELFAELKRDHGFTLNKDNVRVAVADQFAEWDHVLKPGDKVVFIPPVAGG